MIDTAALGKRFISALDRAPDRGHLTQALVDPFWLRHGGNPQQRDAVMKRLKHSLDKAVAATADQRAIEIGLGLQAADQVLLGRRGLQSGQRIANSARDAGVAQSRAFAPRKSLQNGPGIVELPGFLEAYGADHRAAMGDGVDEPVSFQVPQRLADRGTADAHHFAFALHEPLPRLERAGHELKLHVKGALKNGLTKDEIKEILLQVAVYCGVPAGIDAFRNAREAFNEVEAK